MIETFCILSLKYLLEKEETLLNLRVLNLLNNGLFINLNNTLRIEINLNKIVQNNYSN